MRRTPTGLKNREKCLTRQMSESDFNEFAWNYPLDDIEPDIIDWYLVNLAADNVDFSSGGPLLRLAWALLVWKEWLRDANAKNI